MKQIKVKTEEHCFDCGSTDKNLVIVSQGVALCSKCLKTAEEQFKKD